MFPIETTAWISTLAAIAVGVVYYGSAVPYSQLFGPGLVRGAAGSGCVALTFDDGPTPPYTDQILDILRESKVIATFFVNGKQVDLFPDTLRRIQAEGHTIGNHTYSHLFLYFKTRGRIAAEIDRTQESIEKVTGERPRLFRPPYGVRWFGLFPVLKDRQMKDIQWSNPSFDWARRNSPAKIARKALGDIGDGSVILMHDGCGSGDPGRVDRSRTVAALPSVIAGVKQAGLRFVSVDEFVS
ncbi:MAG: polysaccharide deacetylase family protein [Terriglobia bacterium]